MQRIFRNILLKTPYPIYFIYKLLGLKTLAELYVFINFPKSPLKNVIICFGRPHFNRDIDVLQKNHEGIVWINRLESELGRFQSCFIPSQYRQQTACSRAVKLGTNDPFHKAQAFSENVISVLKKRYTIKAVMSANFDYWQSEGMRRACKKMGIPFVVLCREAQTVPKTYQRSLEHYAQYDFKYDGDLILVFNERTAALFKKLNICDAEKIIVTGPPRLDVWLPELGKEKSATEKKTITLLSFYSGYLAPDLFFETLGAVVNLASQPNFQNHIFQIKCKGKEDRKRIKAEMKRRGVPSQNILFSIEPNLKKVFENSQIVIGYNSLAMIEAVLSDATCVVPNWGAAKKSPEANNITPNSCSEKVITFASSKENLEKEITLFLELSLPKREATVDDKVNFVSSYFLFKKDETASERVMKAIKEIG